MRHRGARSQRGTAHLRGEEFRRMQRDHRIHCTDAKATAHRVDHLCGRIGGRQQEQEKDPGKDVKPRGGETPAQIAQHENGQEVTGNVHHTDQEHVENLIVEHCIQRRRVICH